MNTLHHTPSQFSTAFRSPLPHSPSRTPRRTRFFSVRSSLPFPIQKATYHEELRAAVDVVDRACRLCVDVQRSLFSSEGRIVEKNDQTPVTVADFGVQALVSLELSRKFPSIPLVAEEDSGYVRENNLVEAVVDVVVDKASAGNNLLTSADVLEAIDRGGQNAVVDGENPATYWILDPIDGTKGFVKGVGALYVVGLALVIEGEIVLGVMGCPNWKISIASDSAAEIQSDKDMSSPLGMIMAAHVGCGTWKKRFTNKHDGFTSSSDGWTRCFADECCLVPEARFCCPDSQTWESMPLAKLLSATSNSLRTGDKEILLLSACCGSLCKYLMVASGRVSVFIQRVRSDRTIKAWDHAVGQICVAEAGGKVTDWKGRELDFAEDSVERRIIFPTDGILVTNGKLHNQIVDMISTNSAVA